MVPGIIIPKHVTIHPDIYTVSLLLLRVYKYEHTGANNTVNTSHFGWYHCVRAVHRQVLSFLTSLLGNSDRNLSDAAHTQDVSRTACWPPPKKFHFRILWNMLQIPAGNVQCITEKRKGTTGSTNNMETPSQGSSGLAGARCVLAWRNRRDLCLLGETGRICVIEGHLAHQTRKCAKALLVQFPDCSCQKMSAVLKTTQAASGFAKNKPSNKKKNE